MIILIPADHATRGDVPTRKPHARTLCDGAPQRRLRGGFSDDQIDRTFCALRVWAVIRPNEMRTWIRTMDDEKMRKALTWLLEHPWGRARKE
jgi:hypothetical protein